MQQRLTFSGKPFFCGYILAAMVLLTSCKSTEQLNTHSPGVQPVSATTYERKISSINIPVTFQIRELEHRINQEVKGVLYKDDDLEKDNVAITVTKNGDIKVLAENDKLYFSVPLDIYAKGRWQWKACDFCPNLSKTEDTRFSVVMKFESALSLTEEYAIKSSTVSNFEWGTKPTISLGPLTISLARFVEPAMKDQMGMVSKQIDQELTKRINIKEQIRQAWVQMQQPIELDKNYNAWLLVQPQQIRVSPLMARNGEVSMKIGISSFLEVVTDGKPKAQINRTLPKLITDRHLADDIQIGLSSEISYTHASRLMSEQIAGKTFAFEGGKQQIKVNSAGLTGSGDKLLLALDINGKAKAGFFSKKIVGTVYLKAIPYYDAATSSIRIREVEFDLQTKDVLLKTASWLTNNRFRENIQQQVNFPVKTQLDEAKKLLQQTLDQQSNANDYVSLKGKILDITPDNIYLTPTSIKAVVNARGNLHVRLEKL